MAETLALVHDYLTQRGGAERVVATWAAAFPDAPLYTTLYEPTATFEEFAEHRVTPSWLNHLAPLRRHHRLALPLLAPTVSAWRIDADVVLASSSGWAHGVRTDGALVVYCHAPARWLYQRDRYLRAGALGARAHVASRLLAPPLRAWDRRAARRADRYLANSTATRDLVRELYGLDAQVIAPPVSLAAPGHLDAASAVAGHVADVVVVARLLPYKNVDLVLEVAALTEHLRYVVVGEGPLRRALEERAGANVRFVGAVRDDELWEYYAGSRVHLALSHEDFGITPLEAALAGRPTVARRSGGYLDTITSSTGVLVDEAALDAPAVRDALVSALAREWDEATLVAHARTFSPERHLEQLRAVLSSP
jgi:glycosyltransferase involved in cell wall biosynthesis